MTMFLLSCVLTAAVAIPAVTSGFTTKKASAAVFKENPYMAELQLPTEEQYNEKDWKQTTIDFLTYVFDENNTFPGENGERKIARYTASGNAKAYFESIGRGDEAPEDIWSIPPYVGKGDDVTLGEGITVIAAVMSGALAGMDLTAYKCSDGKTRNFVKSVVEYYQAVNGQNVVLNGGAGGKTGVTWWYELLPGVLFSVLGTQYESESWYMYDIITESARQWRSAVEGLGGASADFWHTSYNLATGQPYDGNWYEPDAAAGMAYILYSAYSLNKNLKEEGGSAYATDEEIEEFREAAVWCMNYLEKLDTSPFYEVLTFLAPYLAARMNAEQGTNYDVAKMFGWLLDGTSTVRSGWGMITENWGDKYTNGLMGSLTDGEGYAFAMNTFDAMLGFGPMVKYDTRFARDVSRWVLSASQSAQAYYPEQYSTEGKVEDAGSGHEIYHGKYQSNNWIAQDDEKAGFIAYEGLRRYRRYVVWKDGKRDTEWDKSVTPYASGDAFTFDWGGETDYGLYGSSHVGLFGGTIEYTDVPMIIRTDLNKLDVYSGGNIPFWMYYNPYNEAKQVTVTLQNAGSRLYDTITKTYVQTSAGENGTVKMTIPADTTFILAEIPQGAEVVKNGSNYTCNGEFIAQDRGSVTLSLYTDAEGKEPVRAGSTVEGTIYASLEAVAPEGANVEGVTLTFAGTTIYSGTSAPDGLFSIDTKELKNGKGAITATLTLSGGSIEKSSVSVQVLNVVKTPAVEYESVKDMVDKWNASTVSWQELYPNSDHTSVASANADGEFTVTAEAMKGYGFVTSEMFTMDFSREPMLEFEVTDVSSLYAVKVYVEGMETHNNYTGAYIIRDTGRTGKVTVNILEEIQKEDRTFDMEGAHKACVKISPVGMKGDYVSIRDFNVYHMYTSPVLDEPDVYEWGFNFSPVWMSLWSGSTADGGVNDAALEYTGDGTVKVSSVSAADYSGIASPYIATDLGQNPVFDISLENVTGKYFVGVKFEGSDKLYVLLDGQSSLENSVEVVKALRANYPDDSFGGVMNMRVVVGVSGEGSAEFSGVSTYYKLTSWGTTVKDEAWLDWEKASGTTADVTLETDASDRAVITNKGSSSSDTAIAGVSGKFTVNFDYNPELSIRVRGLTGKWRLSVTAFDGGQKYVLGDWSDKKSTVEFNLNEATGGALRGQKNVYLSIEVLGGGKSVTVDRVETYYTAVAPDFAAGAVQSAEIATWDKDGTNPSNVVVSDQGVTVSESYPDSKGLFTPAVAADAARNPYIVVRVAALSEDALWYVNATVNGKTYALTGGEGSAKLGETQIDVVAALSAAGCKIEGEFSAVYELGGSGAAFSVTFESVRFVYRLAAPEGAALDEDANAIVWNAVAGASGYNVRIEDADGKIVEQSKVSGTSLALASLSLDTGVYRFYITAYGVNALDSAEVRLPFKQGDIESVKLGSPANLKADGMKIVWDEVENAESYRYTLKDADSGETVSEGETTDNFADLAAIGLKAFNFSISVTAAGDGAVYLDSDAANFAFYTNVVENYNAKKFASMAANDNQASASYDEASDVASLTVPYTNWGSVAALETSLNFDNSPVLAIRFAAGSRGGYFLKIMIDGTPYYLADNTFDIHGRTEATDVYIDVNGTLESRKDGPAQAVTGTHKVRVVFGATADGFDGADTPVVKISYAQLIEMTPGAGVAKLGTLETPEVTVKDQVASWNAVPDAEGYIVVVSNETGVLISQTVTGTSFDCTMLKRAGEYTVQVTATAERYYSSDTGSAAFTVTEGGSGGEPAGGCSCKSSFTVYSAALGAGAVLLAGLALLLRRRKNR